MELSERRLNSDKTIPADSPFHSPEPIRIRSSYCDPEKRTTSVREDDRLVASLRVVASVKRRPLITRANFYHLMRTALPLHLGSILWLDPIHRMNAFALKKTRSKEKNRFFRDMNLLNEFVQNENL
ncbi:hypothetical protein TNCV_5012571 [Trichonephila clavipes]|nr:hypothetical protein TNCV_5012571 [Trichonephila clavipes]